MEAFYTLEAAIKGFQIQEASIVYRARVEVVVREHGEIGIFAGLDRAELAFFAEELDGGPWCKIPEGKPGAFD